MEDLQVLKNKPRLLEPFRHWCASGWSSTDRRRQSAASAQVEMPLLVSSKGIQQIGPVFSEEQPTKEDLASRRRAGRWQSPGRDHFRTTPDHRAWPPSLLAAFFAGLCPFWAIHEFLRPTSFLSPQYQSFRLCHVILYHLGFLSRRDPPTLILLGQRIGADNPANSPSSRRTYNQNQHQGVRGHENRRNI